MEKPESFTPAPPLCTHVRAPPHLLHAVIEKGQTGVLVADEGALLNETDEDLRLGELGVELLVGAVSAFQKSCTDATTHCSRREPSGETT